jgi:3-(3-hydroxy-phenyl)propionate hydroxylase
MAVRRRGAVQSPVATVSDRNNHPDAYDVAIVGYGPTGATLANLLAMSGLDVVVLEREDDIYPLPRAVHFDDEVMRVFQTVGIADELEPLLHVNAGMKFVDPDGTLLLDWPRPQEIGPNGWHASYRFHQPSTEALLRRAFEAQTNAAVHLGAEVVSVDENADSAVLRYKDRHTDSLHNVSASFVVGCDGARSVIRQAMGTDMTDLGFEERWLVIDVLLKHDMPELGDYTIQYCDAVRPMTYCRSPANRRRWEIALGKDDDDATVSSPEQVWATVARWIGPDDAELERTAVYTFRSAVAEQWRRGRLLIAGDAAHLTPPFMGQGLCAGIRDAVNLAWKLVLQIQGAPSNELLDTYESERKPHVGAYIETAMRLGALINSVGSDAAQEQVGSASGDEPGQMKSIAPRLGPGLHFGDAVTIGRLFPQPTLAGGRRFDDICGYRPALIARGAMLSASRQTRAGDYLIDANSDEALLECLDALQADAVLVRPDRYVLGTATTPVELDKLLINGAEILQLIGQ